MGLANSLMLDFRCLIIPRFIYSTSEDFTEGKVTDPQVKDRISELIKELERLCMTLNQ